MTPYWRQLGTTLYFATELLAGFDYGTWKEYTGGAGNWDSSITKIVVEPQSLDPGVCTLPEDCHNMFSFCPNLSGDIDLHRWDLSEVSSLNSMFAGCSLIETLDLTGWDISNVYDFCLMFSECSSLRNIKYDGNWVTDSKFYPENILSSYMFQGCIALPNFTTSVLDIWAAHDSKDPSGYFNRYDYSVYWKEDSGKLSITCYPYSGYNNEYLGSEGEWSKDITEVEIKIVSDTTDHYINLPADCHRMFYGCTKLTEIDISGLKTPSADTDLSYMFAGCTSLTTVKDTSLSGLSGSTASHMFDGCTNLSGETISISAEDLSYMFKNTGSLSKYNLTLPTMSSATTMEGMFYESDVDDLYLDKLSSTSCTNYSYMFYHCTKLTKIEIPTGLEWEMSPATTVSHMFDGCTYLTTILGGFERYYFKVGTVSLDMSYMFANCPNLTSLNFKYFNANYVSDMRSVFYKDYYLAKIYAPDWVDQATTIGYSTNMFYMCESLPNFTADVVNIAAAHDCNDSETPKGYFNEVKIALYYKEENSILYIRSIAADGYSEYTGGAHPWSNNITEVNTNKIGQACKFPSNCSNMFSNCSLLTTISGDNWWNMSIVKNMSYMFANCTSLSSATITCLTSAATDMNHLFYNCTSLKTTKLTGLLTSKVVNFSYLFSGCSSLETIDVSTFDTSKATNISFMFNNCNSLKSIDVSNFNTSLVTYMSSMFNSCSNLTYINLKNFDTSKVERALNVFANCASLKKLYLNNFNVSSFKHTDSMFYNDSELEVIYSTDWVDQASSELVSTDMFYNCIKLPDFDSSVTDISAAFDCNESRSVHGYFNIDNYILYKGSDKINRDVKIMLKNKKTSRIYKNSICYWEE